MLQYYHRHLGEKKFTVCIDVPSKEHLVGMIKYDVPQVLTTQIGFAFCSPKDQYSKAVGRKISSSTMQTHNLFLTGVEFEGDVYKLYFVGGDDIPLVFLFRIHKNSDLVYFLGNS